MNKLTFIKRFAFAVLSLLITANLWGQAALSGSGKEKDPYLITSTADWNKFATAVNGGYSYNGEYLKLTADITLTINNQTTTDTMVGTVTQSGSNAVEDKFFSGTFDGDWHTITFKVGNKKTPYTPATTVTPSAPFCVIDGATINNLKVTDTIFAGNKYNSGLVGFAWKTQGRDNYINNCTSSIVINCSGITPDSNPDCSSAGFVAENKTSGSKLYFENCIFDGKIDKGTHTTAWKCAGFLSYNNGSTVYYSHCTMAGTINLTSETATFHRKANASFSNAYYITNYMNSTGSVSPQGVQATTTEPTDDLARKYTVGTTDYYVPGAVITGLETTTYSYTGNDIIITPDVTYYGRTLTKDTDYVINYEKKNGDVWESASVINAAGDYRIIISGTGNYAGSYTSSTIHVVSYNTWAAVKDILADDSEGDRNITLSANITADVNYGTNTALVVNGTVTLNLNGHTINRALVHVNDKHEIVEDYGPDYNGAGQVIIIESGASLTINGSGTITGGFHKGDATYIDGGGIYNLGTLVLNNVSVVGNKVIKRTDGTPDQNNFSGRGGGIYSGNNCSLNITGGEIADNEAIGGGGGIYCDRSNPFNMTGVMIRSNISEDKGGGIRVVVSNGKTANLTDCNFINNCATVNTESKGGGIYCDGQSNNSTLNLVNDTFTANSSFLLGGAIYLHRGTITATNCDMDNNVSFSDEVLFTDEESYGGAVCLYSNSTYIMDGGSITGDWSKTNGGGIYIYPNAVLKVKGNVIITNNTQMDFDEEMELISSNNNVYLAGAASGDKIQVVGELGPDAVIGIANSEPGTYIAVADGVSLDHILEHVVLDNNENQMIINGSGEVEVYVPYPWDDEDTWDGTIATITEGSYPPTTSNDVTINRAVKISSESVAYANDITFGTYGSIIIEDGGQLINNNSIAVVAKKEIVAADVSEKSGWYIISSPVTDAKITSATNLITPVADARYDLYRFNESASLPWENYKASHGDFTILQNGRGYLYRNEHNHIVDIDGNVNVSDVTYNLSCSGSGDFKGFNLIGNPYAENITLLNTTLVDNSGKQIVDGEGNPINLTGYYKLSKDDGSWGTEITSTSATIAPLEGILVQVDEARKVKFSRTARAAAKSNGDNIKFTVANDQYEDKTYALFEKGLGLEKIEHMNEDVPMVYISNNGADYAIATFGDEVKQFNLNFEAKTTGMYTLGMKTQGEFSYVHVIDKLAEKDIDMLNDGEYSFIGTPADEPDRFIVRLAYLPDYSDEGDDNFVYQNGSEVLVSGQGELQVFDVMGRLVMQKKVNGVESVDGLRTGVYVMRIVGESVKTQKIVIR